MDKVPLRIREQRVAQLERLEQMRRFAREHALAFLEQQKKASGNKLSDDEAMKVALEGQRVARKRIRDVETKSKRSRKK